MKKLIGTLIASTLILAGCGSTPELTRNPETNESFLKVASTETYQWNTENSAALNIANLAKPAGVGFGMSDTLDPKGTDLGRQDSSLLSGVSGFMMGGIGGAAGMLAMDDEINKKRDWNVSFIQTFEMESLDMADPADANKSVNQRLAKSILKTLRIEYPDTELVVVTNHQSPKIKTNTGAFLFTGKICSAARAYGYVTDDDPMTVEEVSKSVNFIFKNKARGVNDACYLLVDSQVSGTINGKYVVVSEVTKNNISLFLTHKAAETYDDGYVIFPDRSTYFISNVTNSFGSMLKKHYWRYPYPMVMKGGQQLLLDKEEQSSPDVM